MDARPLATRTSRALAWVFDGAWAGTSALLAVFGIAAISRWPGAGRALLALGIAGVLAYGAVALLWVRRDGQTPGKKLLGIAVRTLDGERATLARIFWLRNAVPTVLSYVPFFVGDIFSVANHAAIFSKHRRCVHDYIAGTEVIQIAERKSARTHVLLAAAAILVVPVLLLAVMCFEAFEIEGPSNEPGMLSGERVITLRLLPFIHVPLEAGDLVIATSPTDGVMIAKRIIGLPGDVVEIRANKIILNGNELPARDMGPCTLGMGARQPNCRIYETMLGRHRFQISTGHVMDSAPTQVPEGSYFILGDHLDSSNDSRNPAIGPVSHDAIHALILTRYWSSSEDGVRWGRILQPLP